MFAMCGFAGLVACDQRYRIDVPTLSRMGQAVAHRGPDGRDQWINHQEEITPQNPQCALTFARLAILDLDRRAMQPMTDGRRWLVFNGEIYNFRELRERLRQIDPQYSWKTNGDSEVLLRAYDAWGEYCPEQLNGMFALAIWDPAERRLFLARDRMGQKPLYIALAPDNRAIAFASEPGALRVLDWPDWSVDPTAVAEYLQNGYVPLASTIYKGMRRVTPGSFLVFAPGSPPRGGAYFDPNIKSGEATVEGIKAAVLTAVRRQLVSDVPVGCFLSGGMDSSVIAAAMDSALGPGQRLLTFSIGFDDPRYDETGYAAAVARHLGTEHRQFTVRPDAAADLPRLAAVFGEPFGDSSALPTHYLARQTREHVKVALSGDGGDELFGGYDRYRAMLWAQRLSRFPNVLARAAAMISGTHPKSRAARIKRFARSLHLPPAQRYAAYMALFDQQLLGEIYSHPSQGNIVESTYARLQSGRDVVQAALATDRVTYLPDDLLVKLDRTSMLHALEVRSPFMDHELVGLAAGLSTQQLLAGGPKRMLRQAFAAELPDFVFRRRKMGFAVPIGQWLRGTLRPMLHDLLESSDSFARANFSMPVVRRMMADHHTHRMDYSQSLYALIMLELWWRGQARPA
jgi:asparagine synthase (glutamine-hydrolysing)